MTTRSADVGSHCETHANTAGANAVQQRVVSVGEFGMRYSKGTSAQGDPVPRGGGRDGHRCEHGHGELQRGGGLLGLGAISAGIPTALTSNESTLIGGLFVWTLTEYVLHRYVFHWTNDTAFGKRVHFLLHGVHHDYPQDKDRLVMPIGASAGLAGRLIVVSPTVPVSPTVSVSPTVPALTVPLSVVSVSPIVPTLTVPSVAVAVIVEGQPGASEQTGGKVAAPIARSVLEAALRPISSPQPGG